jgi:hypothetical protein
MPSVCRWWRLSAIRSHDWKRRLVMSQRAALQSVTLLIVGVYLLFMASAGYYVRFFGGEWGRAVQMALLFAALLVLVALTFSGSMRARLRVQVGKHFFSYRYDYREEWLRFTQTLSAQGGFSAMGQHVVRGWPTWSRARWCAVAEGSVGALLRAGRLLEHANFGGDRR